MQFGVSSQRAIAKTIGRLFSEEFRLKTISVGSGLILLMVASIFYGMVAQRYRLFPAGPVETAAELYRDAVRTKKAGMPGLHVIPGLGGKQDGVTIYHPEKAMPGLNFLSRTMEDAIKIQVIDMAGVVLHEWPIFWSRLWPKADHLLQDEIPTGDFFTNVHGIVLLENGDIVFNFGHLGLMRLDSCGDVVWRLPYRTHHSVWLAENGNFWVSGQKNHDSELEGFPSIRPPFIEPTVLEVSPNEEILREISLLSVLARNEFFGLICSHSVHNTSVNESDDIFHLNDVELFPTSLVGKNALFAAGDIMVSLRNINTVMVFDAETLKIKWIETGKFLRQHDPDFREDGRISVLDNNNQGPLSETNQSRIIVYNYDDRTWESVYQGTDVSPFYSNIMGKHQWLQNGNLLVTESKSARAFEVTKSGEIVWEFVNKLGEETGGLVMQVDRYDLGYADVFQSDQICAHSR